ncbi:MAG: hypothetical protein ABSE73_08015 [Planctomycetota bacterium]
MAGARVALLLTLLLAAGVSAGELEPTVTTNATGTAPLKPESLELIVALKAAGPDGGSVVAALKDLRERAAAKLQQALGVGAQQIESGELAALESPPPRNGKKAKEPPACILGQELRVHAPLKGENTAALALEAHALQRKAAEALESFKRTPAEGTEAAHGRLAKKNDAAAAKPPGALAYASLQVRCFFYAPLTGEVRAAAVRDALQKAEAEAQSAAKLLGKSLALLSLTIDAAAQAAEGEDQEETSVTTSDDDEGTEDEAEPQPVANDQESAAAPDDTAVRSRSPNLRFSVELKAEFLLK